MSPDARSADRHDRVFRRLSDNPDYHALPVLGRRPPLPADKHASNSKPTSFDDEFPLAARIVVGLVLAVMIGMVLGYSLAVIVAALRVA